jgi:hypothetical protein
MTNEEIQIELATLKAERQILKGKN